MTGKVVEMITLFHVKHDVCWKVDEREEVKDLK